MKFNDVIYHLNHTFMFKFQSNLLPSAFSNFFTPVSSKHKYKTRLPSRSTFCIPVFFFFTLCYTCASMKQCNLFNILN